MKSVLHEIMLTSFSSVNLTGLARDSGISLHLIRRAYLRGQASQDFRVRLADYLDRKCAALDASAHRLRAVKMWLTGEALAGGLV